MEKRVIAIVVTYNPDIVEFEKNLNTYINQVDKILILDNSDNSSIKKELAKTITKYRKVQLIDLKENKGIAYAQNIGYKYALENNFEYVLEMDQDSFLPKNYVTKLVEQMDILLKKGIKVAGIGGIAFDFKEKKFYETFKDKNFLIKVDKTLSSGFLVNLKYINKIGFKDENLFLDFVDWEWCWRAYNKGFLIFKDKRLKIFHRMGLDSRKIFFIRFSIPSPIRHYYQFRNPLLLIRYKHVPNKDKFILILKMIIKLVLYPIILDNRKKRLKYMLKGIWDGIKGKKGKFY